MGQQLLQCLECGRFKSFTFCFTGIWSQNLTNSWNTNVFGVFFGFFYLDIFSSWPGTLWSLRSRDRDCQRVMGTGGPAVCGSPGPAWTHRFYRTESRGSTRSTHPRRSALNWERELRVRSFSVYLFYVNMASKVWNGTTLSSTSLVAPTNRTSILAGYFLPNGLTLSCALHEFVIGLVVLWTDMVAPPTELVQAWSAPRTCLTVHTRLTVCRTLCKDSTAQWCICEYSG